MTSSRAASYLPNGGKVVAMRKVEALIHPYKLEDVKAELKNLDFEDIAVSEVFLTGPRNTIKTRYRGCEYEADVPRLKVEVLLFTNDVEEVVDALARAASTGTGSDDGSIIVYEVLDAIRIGGGRPLEPALRERAPRFIRDLLPAANPAA
jgi:nitrogen regulatory protein PII